MIRARLRLGVAICVVAALAACGSTTQEKTPSLFSSFATQLISQIKSGRQGRKPVATVTPQMLDNTKVPALQVNPEKVGGSDFLRRIAQRRDGGAGVVDVWRSSDQAQLFIRAGVVVGTRGVRGDIISADATGTIRALRRGQGGTVTRRYTLSRGDHTTQDVTLRCQITALGRGTTQVVHLSFATDHFRETCTGVENNALRVTNDYWVQPDSRLVRKSRQWMGPFSGYFELILLRN